MCLCLLINRLSTPPSEHLEYLQLRYSATRTIDIQSSGYLSVAVSHASTENTESKPVGNFFPLGTNGGWLISISQVSSCVLERGLFDQCIGRRDQRCPTKPGRGILKRENSYRRRDLSQDTSVSFPAQCQPRDAVVGSFARQSCTKSERTPPTRGVYCSLRRTARRARPVGWDAADHPP